MSISNLKFLINYFNYDLLQIIKNNYLSNIFIVIKEYELI